VLVRNAAVTLAFFGQPAARPELSRGLHDSDAYRRWDAVFSLKNVGDPSVAEALIPLLDVTVESAVRVRQETALTLGSIGGDKARDALLVALRREDISFQVRWRAAPALEHIGDSSVVGELRQALSFEKDPQVLEFIQKAIDQLG
jgi:HEAT repeat protein